MKKFKNVCLLGLSLCFAKASFAQWPENGDLKVNRVSTIALMQRPYLPVYDSSQINASGQPTGQKVGVAAGIFMNEITGRRPGQSEKVEESKARYSKPSTECLLESVAQDGSALYHCTLTLIMIQINQRDWTVVGADVEPEYGFFIKFDTRVKRTADGDLDAQVVSDFVTRGYAG